MGLLMVMVGLVTIGVFFRYVLNASLSWYDEFASYLLVWLSFYGAIASTARGRHISFDTLVEKLGPVARKRMALVSEALSAVFYAVLLVYGAMLVRTMGEETAISLPWIRMAWVYSALPISGGLMLAITLTRVVAILRGRDSGRTPHADPVPTTSAE
jgi:TRAP-type transport system small permease protein